MKSYFLRHLFQYALLILIVLVGAFAFFSLESSFERFVVVFSLTALYVIWGIWHHYEERNLTLEVMLEYVVMAAFIFWVLVAAVQ